MQFPNNCQSFKLGFTQVRGIIVFSFCRRSFLSCRLISNILLQRRSCPTITSNEHARSEPEYKYLEGENQDPLLVSPKCKSWNIVIHSRSFSLHSMFIFIYVFKFIIFVFEEGLLFWFQRPGSHRVQCVNCPANQRSV